jgi:hypothetical protein
MILAFLFLPALWLVHFSPVLSVCILAPWLISMCGDCDC